LKVVGVELHPGSAGVNDHATVVVFCCFDLWAVNPINDE